MCKLNMNKVIDIIFGGNAGSEGKGKFAGFLSQKKNYRHAITNFFPNAGHTWVSDEGEIVLTRYLPSSLVNLETKLYLGPGSAIDLEVLMNEIDRYDPKYKVRERLYIHPRAAIVREEHVIMEREVNLERIGSTLKGGSAALAMKAMRNEKLSLAKDVPELEGFLVDTEERLHQAIENNESILIEGAQGFELDINYGFQYPYTTCRQTTPAQLVADSGLPVAAVRDIYCVIRTYPIRVGGTSGPLSGNEIDWSTIEQRAEAPKEVELAKKEITTVTGKQRRVFEYDVERLKYMINVTSPTYICLNFIQYIDYSDLEKTEYDKLSAKSKDLVTGLENELNTPILLIGTGRLDKHLIVRSK
jgi:adenylosuccinate synthase